jgi:hypothetical protein
VPLVVVVLDSLTSVPDGGCLVGDVDRKIFILDRVIFTDSEDHPSGRRR